MLSYLVTNKSMFTSTNLHLQGYKYFKDVLILFECEILQNWADKIGVSNWHDIERVYWQLDHLGACS